MKKLLSALLFASLCAAQTATTVNPDRKGCTVGVDPNLQYTVPTPNTFWQCVGPPGLNAGTYMQYGGTANPVQVVNTTGQPPNATYVTDSNGVPGFQKLSALAVNPAPYLSKLSGLTNQIQSGLIANAVYQDSLSTLYTETWANNSAWSNNTHTQVSGGNLYSNGGGAAAGMNYGVGLGTTGTLRAQFPVTITSGSAVSGGPIIGVNSDAVGAVPGSAASHSAGLYFLGGVGSSPSTMYRGSVGAANYPSGYTLAAATYIVTIVVDSTEISVTAAVSGSWPQIRAHWSRSSFGAVNNIFIFNSDSSQLTGGYVGPGWIKKGLATQQGTSPEGVQYSTIWNVDANGNNFKIEFPPGYDSRKPAPVLMFFHGHGSDENYFSDGAGVAPIHTAFQAAGYILVTAAQTSYISSWGAQGSIDTYYHAYQYLQQNFSIGSVGIFANSMGGIESELFLADYRVPGISWWVGFSPTYSLADNYGNSLFTSTINTSYGITGTAPNTYALLTAGHDPSLMSGSAFRGIPMMILTASDDVTVHPAQNGQALATAVTPYAYQLTVVPGITGGHSFNISPYVSQILAFAAQFNGN